MPWILVLALMMLPTPEADAQAPRRSKTMRESVYLKIAEAQGAAQREDYATALRLLEKLADGRDLLSYERAQVQSSIGYVYFSQGDYAKSRAAYEAVLEEEGIPEALASSTHYVLAQLSFQLGDYAEVVSHLEPSITAASSPAPLMLLAHAHYELKQFREAVEPIERALALAGERGDRVEESWLLLLRAVYTELEDYARLRDTLERLVTSFPKKAYWLHLASTYATLDQQDRRLAVYELLHAGGQLDTGEELRRYARLLMLADVPYRAGMVIDAAIEKGDLDGDADDHRLLADAWIQAREMSRAVDALSTAVEISKDPEVQARLARCYLDLERWEEAVAAAEAAVRGGLKKTDGLHLSIGVALTELGRYEEAKAAFRIAQKEPASASAAGKWIEYIDRETERERSLRRSYD